MGPHFPGFVLFGAQRYASSVPDLGRVGSGMAWSIRASCPSGSMQGSSSRSKSHSPSPEDGLGRVACPIPAPMCRGSVFRPKPRRRPASEPKRWYCPLPGQTEGACCTPRSPSRFSGQLGARPSPVPRPPSPPPSGARPPWRAKKRSPWRPADSPDTGGPFARASSDQPRGPAVNCASAPARRRRR